MNNSVAFFHPYQGSKGYAAVFDFAADRGVFFAKFMPEIDGKFSKEYSVSIAIGNNDLGEILAVLKGRKAGVGNYKDNRWSGLYHDLKAKNTSTVLNLYLNENQDSYNLSVSQKVDGGDPRRAGGRLTLGEASLLLAFLEAHLPAYFAAQTAKQEQEWAARRNEAGGEPAKPTQPAKAASAPSKAPTGAKAPTVSSIANSGRSKPPAAHEDDIPF